MALNQLDAVEDNLLGWMQESEIQIVDDFAN
jgi:hypothetical protein